MGKGGTRFVADAVGHRSGRPKTTYSNKELKKNMDAFLETGFHPELKKSEEVYPLPEHDKNRPHVFLEISSKGEKIGKLVIELFEDILPTTVAHFRHRFTRGSSLWLQGTKFYKIQSGYAVFGGLESRPQSTPHGIRRTHRLRHASYGSVSVAADGSDFAISLGRSLKLDDTHQVVGRVHTGREVLERMDGMVTSSLDDSPLAPVTVAKCGPCDPNGTYDSFDDAGCSSQKLSAEETAELLQNESEATKESVRDAVLSGLNKRKGPAAAQRATETHKRPRMGMMEGVLGAASGSSGSSSEGE